MASSRRAGRASSSLTGAWPSSLSSSPSVSFATWLRRSWNCAVASTLSPHATPAVCLCGPQQFLQPRICHRAIHILHGFRARRRSMVTAAPKKGGIAGPIGVLSRAEGAPVEPKTSDPAALRSGKGHRDENFPVASWLIDPRHRGIILAFYEFVRIADDIADHARLPPQQKLDLLDRLEAGLLGRHDDTREAVTLRLALSERGLAPRHAQDLLTAFRMDVTKLRYHDWDDLMHYCSYSAMPVGRFVLDVHGEDRSSWPANDALCAALQIINHLQDCRKDYRDLDRVYVPLDALAEAGASVDELGGDRAGPQLLGCIGKLARRTGDLLRDSRPFSASIDDTRLALEVAVIQTFAERLVRLLAQRDPLSERVHLGKAGVAGFGVLGLLWGATRRVGRVFAAGQKT